MHKDRVGKGTSYLLLTAVLMLAPVTAIADDDQAAVQAPAPAAAPELSNDDCIKCHTGPPQDIQALGGAHRSEVTCMDCHQGHPPTVTDNIPQCSNCHTGKAHFELEGCLSCHMNPHTPLQITLSGDITDPCLTCHTSQIAQLRENQSAHTALACNTCHEQHGVAPECMKCHEPHANGMTMADCTSCHRAHMPLQVAYPEDISSKHCASCHATAYDLLAASPAKHSELACATCHQEKHKMVPQCTGCHGIPHPEGIMAKFPKCGDCHGIAHNLNSFSPAAEEKKKNVQQKKK